MQTVHHSILAAVTLGLISCGELNTDSRSGSRWQNDASSSSSDGTSDQPGSSENYPSPGQSNQAGVPCEGDEHFCDLDTVLYCDNGTWSVVDECTGPMTCAEATASCVEKLCDRGEAQCADETHIQFCETDQTAWTEPTTCPEAQLCAGGNCMRPQCFPGVMLLIDHSESMFTQWYQVKRSIHRLMTSNPSVRFGMTSFPNRPVDDNVCLVGDNWPEIPIQDEPAEPLAGWLEESRPVGATPLALTLQWITANADSLWNGEEMGYLLILSDGADTCSCKQAPIGPERNACLNARFVSSTQSLLEQHGVRTYVIGYNFEDETGGLNAIAQNGGTEETDYTYVGNETELDRAFEQVIREIKDCH